MSRTFFTDRDLGNAFPAQLRASGLTVERHADHFLPGTPDEDWLRDIGQRGWVAVTRDTRIRYKPNEVAAVRLYRVALLVLVGKAPHADLAANFVRTAERIETFLGRNPPPLIAKIYRPAPADRARDPDAPGTISRWD